jgi:hypothetical protein
VEQKGPACHTGEASCFYRSLAKRGHSAEDSGCASCGGCGG